MSVNLISEISAYDGYMLYIIVTALIIPVFLLGIFANVKVNSTFSKFSRMDSRTNMTAAEAARKVLDSEGLFDVQIRRIRDRKSVV